MPQFVGLDSVKLWFSDAKANLDTTHTDEMGSTGVFTIDLLTSKGATAFNIANLSPSNTAVYGSDAMAEHLVGTAAPTITVSANDLPFGVSQLLMGAEKDETNGGYALKGHGKQVTGGAIGITHWDGVKAYICFPFGLWTQNGGINLATSTNNPTVVHDSFQLAAQARPTDDLLEQMYMGDQKNFTEDKMLQYIVQGYGSSANPTNPGGGTQTTPPTNPASK